MLHEANEDIYKSSQHYIQLHHSEKNLTHSPETTPICYNGILENLRYAHIKSMYMKQTARLKFGKKALTLGPSGSDGSSSQSA